MSLLTRACEYRILTYAEAEDLPEGRTLAVVFDCEADSKKRLGCIVLSDWEESLAVRSQSDVGYIREILADISEHCTPFCSGSVYFLRYLDTFSVGPVRTSFGGTCRLQQLEELAAGPIIGQLSFVPENQFYSIATEYLAGEPKVTAQVVLAPPLDD